MTIIYKIVPEKTWRSAGVVFTGAAIDVADGYIHLSTADQVEETAAKHFAGQAGLVLVAFDADMFGPALRWEPSRGGALFPHLYDTLKTADALWVKALPWNGLAHDFPSEWRA